MTPLTIDQLAQSVINSDGFNRHTTVAQVRHILEVALKSKVAVAALSQPIELDLGNGHVLTCSVALADSIKNTAK